MRLVISGKGGFLGGPPFVVLEPRCTIKGVPGADQHPKETAKVLADETAVLAEDLASETTQKAEDLVQEVSEVASELADKTVVIAEDLADKTTEIATTLARQTAGVADELAIETVSTARVLESTVKRLAGAVEELREARAASLASELQTMFDRFRSEVRMSYLTAIALAVIAVVK